MGNLLLIGAKPDFEVGFIRETSLVTLACCCVHFLLQLLNRWGFTIAGSMDFSLLGRFDGLRLLRLNHMWSPFDEKLPCHGPRFFVYCIVSNVIKSQCGVGYLQVR